MGTKSMVHLNGDMLCAVDIKTTGPTVGYHELLQIAIVPLNNVLVPQEIHLPFDIWIKPRYLDRSDPAYERTCYFDRLISNGQSLDATMDLFDSWFRSLNLFRGKRISILCEDWKHIGPFLQHWLGEEYYHSCFSPLSRELKVVAAFLDDRADFSVQQIPFPVSHKFRTSSLARYLNIPFERSEIRDSLTKAYLIAKVYKTMCVEPLL